MNGKSVVRLFFFSFLYMLTCEDVSFSITSLFLCLLDILKSLILLIFKGRKKKREEGFFAAGCRRGICV